MSVNWEDFVEWQARAKAAEAENDYLHDRVEVAERVLRSALPSLGANRRTYAQLALEEACELLRENPDAWRVSGELALEREWRERLSAANEALRQLYDYTVALENASAPWFATRSYAVLPSGGLEVGKQVRAVLDALEASGD